MTIVPQAGAVAFRASAHGSDVLLVRAKKDPTVWVFPKGHVESGESIETAALRELREEAGVQGTIVDALGTLEFQSGSERVQVAYFLVRYTGDVPPAESRERRWCSYDEAHELLGFPNARRLLESARPLMTP
jgi:ADP-ribose pyrophosphatase YjhB (NUDIX family)